MGRSVKYRKADGTLSEDRKDAIRATEADVRGSVAGSVVPARYYLGTAEHESGYALNEVDTEDSGFQSYGIFQISDEEAAGYGGLGDWWTLEDASRVFIPTAESRARSIAGSTPLTDLRPDFWAFLVVAHNLGLQFAINDYPKESFKEFIDANLAEAKAGTSKSPASYWAKLSQYGNDCVPQSWEIPGADDPSSVAASMARKGSIVAFLFFVGTVAGIFAIGAA